MPLFLLPSFISDLQQHGDANFAKRVLLKAIKPDGSFREDADDHTYHGIDDAWIKYVSRKRTGYRVIFIRKGESIYLFRAGEHSVEDNLVAPAAGFAASAIAIDHGNIITDTLSSIEKHINPSRRSPDSHRFKRNFPNAQIQQEIFSRRNLPHKDIWLVCPRVEAGLFAPTGTFGKLLLDQVEDGASVSLIVAPPEDRGIEWMETLAERNIGVFIYPRLQSKLYCFVFDEERRYENGLLSGEPYSSLILLGSPDMTSAGMAIGSQCPNEELCYSVPSVEISYVEDYVIELMTKGYELREVRRLLARGQWNKLEGAA